MSARERWNLADAEGNMPKILRNRTRNQRQSSDRNDVDDAIVNLVQTIREKRDNGGISPAELRDLTELEDIISRTQVGWKMTDESDRTMSVK